jgi:hypothetical protein
MGMSDVGAEIHVLLEQCMQPLGHWLPIPEIADEGLNLVRLIDPQERLPTVECEELASGFAGLAGLLEERIFESLKEALGKQTDTEADRLYSDIREYVVRHPVVGREELSKFCGALPTQLWHCVQHRFYEPVAGGPAGRVTVCVSCGNTLREAAGGYLCTTQACMASQSSKPGDEVEVATVLRLRKALRQYWLEPGFDEIRLYDKLRSAGLPARLYPHSDRVDIDLGDDTSVGIDLKAYASPELLGKRIKERPGGLLHYEVRLLVIPDWLVRRTPGYLERLRAALESSPVRCLCASDAERELAHAREA